MMIASDSATSGTRAPTRKRGRSVHERRAAAIVVALIASAAVGALVWFFSSDDSTGPTNATASAIAPSALVQDVPARIVSTEALRRLARNSGSALYWAGARPATRIEYTRRSDGATFVRYLTAGAKAGDPHAGYVVVATYSQAAAYEHVSAIASRTHLFKAHVGHGGIAVTRPGRRQNIYLVYPNVPYQIEVYAPTSALARQLVFAGAIKPVD